jgi:hypothetical protein
VSRYISEDIRSRVRKDCRDRCSYCLSSQQYILGILEIDHIIPRVDGGSDSTENLCLACRLCNSYKSFQTSGYDLETSQKIALFNLRKQHWLDHFNWSESGIYVIAKTACGQVTIDALQLNNSYAVTVCTAWVSVGWHPPMD